MTSHGDRGRSWLLGFGLLAAAVALRLPGLWTELWMDEILSLRNVEALLSPAGVFTAIHSDNNHYLNSLWLWAVGPGSASWLMRLPPLVLGTTLVALAYRIGRRRGRSTGVVTAALFAVSYPLVHYASEARGYGYLVFLSVLSYVLYRAWVEDSRRSAALGYALVASLAFLAHLGFAPVFAAFLIWSALEIRDARGHRRAMAREHIAVQAFPAVTLILLYTLDIRLMDAAGGFARLSAGESLIGAAGLVVGVAPGWIAVAVAVCAWLGVAAALLRDRAEHRNEAAFFAAAILLTLASGALPGYGYPRYYLPALLFALILLGRMVGRLLEARGARRAAGLALLVLVAAANLSQVLQFAAVGRGMYREAVAYMAAATGFGVATVAGSHDMGSVLALDYYDEGLPSGAQIVYYCRQLSTPGCERVRPDLSRGEGVPAFYLIASLEDRFAAAPELDVPGLGRYRFLHSYPKYGLSGVYWALYRVAAPSEAR